jgi:hypothetical protein
MLRRDAGAGTRNYRSDEDRSQPAVQSVNRAINILSCLGDGINTLTDIAHNCNLVLHYPYPAALSFIGPEARISPRINDFLKELKESGCKISDNVADVLKN